MSRIYVQLLRDAEGRERAAEPARERRGGRARRRARTPAPRLRPGANRAYAQRQVVTKLMYKHPTDSGGVSLVGAQGGFLS